MNHRNGCFVWSVDRFPLSIRGHIDSRWISHLSSHRIGQWIVCFWFLIPPHSEGCGWLRMRNWNGKQCSKSRFSFVLSDSSIYFVRRQRPRQRISSINSNGLDRELSQNCKMKCDNLRKLWAHFHSFESTNTNTHSRCANPIHFWLSWNGSYCLSLSIINLSCGFDESVRDEFIKISMYQIMVSCSRKTTEESKWNMI